MTARNKTRVLFYAVNGLGLGHLVRCLNLHEALSKKLKRKYHPFFISSSDASRLLDRFNIEYAKFPSKTVVKNWQVSYDDCSMNISQSVDGLFGAFKPDIVMIDTLASGSWDELLSIRKRSDAFWILINRSRRNDAWSQSELEMLKTFHWILNPL